jgi:protein-disulfide isomerase
MNTWMQIFSDWFEKGKPLRETFFKNLQLNMDNPAIATEFKKHEAWKEKTKLRATPTILVNGYQLPENYKIEDLRYLTEFDVNVK